MLSYQHGFHAGNFADVLKHLVLQQVLQYLQKKPKAFVVIDTHAGAGGYYLHHAQGQKNQEYTTGIGALWQRNDLPDDLAAYVQLIRSFQKTAQLDFYPGSPLITQALIPQGTRQVLFELHPREFSQLQQQLNPRRSLSLQHSDGFEGLTAFLPPVERRGLIFIDPPYELKSDYSQVIQTLITAHKRFATGIYALWYPVTQRGLVDRLEAGLVKTGIANMQLFELSIAPDSLNYGMTGCGMILINPPYTLKDQLEKTLPYLAKTLAPEHRGHWRIATLTAE